MVGFLAEGSACCVFVGRIRIAEDFESIGIAIEDDLAETVGRIVITQMARDVANPQTAFRQRLVVVRLPLRPEFERVPLCPLGPFPLLIGFVYGRIEIESEYICRMKDGI